MDPPAARTFRIGPCIGRGGFGEVYRATMRTSGGLETEVALKVLRPDPTRGTDAARRFRDEGRMLSRLQHPAVVRALDWADLGDGHQALVTEFVDGADLHACAATGMPLRPLLEVVGAVASALDAAWHAPGPDGTPLRVIHRDVKPTNVRIGRHGQVRLLDFGIASFGSDDREARTESDLVVGSMPYMAPERFAERTSSPAADVYGLGCCLFEGLAREPFHLDARLRELSVLALDPRRADEHRARRLAALAPGPSGEGVAPAVRALLDACLAHDPARRPSAAEVAARCEELAEGADGPTLRRWCADTQLPQAEVFESSWSGRLVTEGAPSADEDRPAPAAPTTVHAPAETVEVPADPSAPAGPATTTRAEDPEESTWVDRSEEPAGAGALGEGALDEGVLDEPAPAGLAQLFDEPTLLHAAGEPSAVARLFDEPTLPHPPLADDRPVAHLVDEPTVPDSPHDEAPLVAMAELVEDSASTSPSSAEGRITEEFADVERPERPAQVAEAETPPPEGSDTPDAPPATGRGARAAVAMAGGLGCAMLVAAALGAVALAVVAAFDPTW